MSVMNSYHHGPVRQARAERLRFFAQQLLLLAEGTLRDAAPRTVSLSGGVTAAATPTATAATRDERHAAVAAAKRELARPFNGVSVSHAREVSLLLLSPEPERFGIDLERTTPERVRLADRIRSRLESEILPLGVPWIDVLRCFCAKEAAFKSLSREAQHGLTFRKLAVDHSEPDGYTWVRCVDDGRIAAQVYVAVSANLVVAVAEAVPV